MNSQEFVIWLKGFTEGVHEYNITPKQWELLKEKLGQVIGDDNKFIEKPHIGTPIGIGGWGTPNGTFSPPNHDLVERYPWGGQKIWGGSGTAGTPIDCLTTSGYVQRSDIPVNNSVTLTVTTGSSGLVYTTSGPDVHFTGTTYNPVSGSWHYTNTNDKTLLND